MSGALPSGLGIHGRIALERPQCESCGKRWPLIVCGGREAVLCDCLPDGHWAKGYVCMDGRNRPQAPNSVRPSHGR